MPAVLFKASDYYGIMADECRLTIVGKFLKPRPQIDRIRSKFKELIFIKGSVKIGVYDNYNVFLDFTNEEDFNFFWYKRVVEIEGQQMWLQRWSPDFKPKEDLPVAPVWVLLPRLHFHMHRWQYVKQVVSAVGTPLEMDLATRGKARPSMAKVRIEIDLLKQQPDSVYVGQVYDDAPQKGFVQKLEYEGVPRYYKHCRKLRHNMMNCRVLERKGEMKKKEREAKQDKEVNLETKKDGEKKENIAAVTREGSRINPEQHSQRKQGHNVELNNKNESINKINNEEQPSDENKAKNQERMQGQNNQKSQG
ncbi:uncharacterized protein [Nicotiana tomentosiformis]|uniref:uncharacterized protein n=1 Tax=Nicotiana tomentosiformis TaxID=4098 RepID=UPI00051BA9D4|nr:uncharacterized protein LOC104104285 [Nicotiana tomentosiformis]